MVIFDLVPSDNQEHLKSKIVHRQSYIRIITLTY